MAKGCKEDDKVKYVLRLIGSIVYDIEDTEEALAAAITKFRKDAGKGVIGAVVAQKIDDVYNLNVGQFG